MRDRRWLAAFAVTSALIVGACTGNTATVAEEDPPAVTEPSGQEGLSRITLSPSAAERLGIEIGAVVDADVDGEARKAMPYGALIYEPDGSTWAYTSPEELVFIRAPLTVDRVDGDEVLLLDGPAAGTEVVSVGAAELYGIEYGIGH